MLKNCSVWGSGRSQFRAWVYISIGTSLGASKIRPNIVYAYEGSSRSTFREAQQLGITTIFEHTSSYWPWTRQLLAEEAECNPDFAGLLPILTDSTENLERKEEELRRADYVFVPSEQVHRTLLGIVPEGRIRVIRYGAPPLGLGSTFPSIPRSLSRFCLLAL